MNAFLSGIESCAWLKHIRALLETSVFIAKVMVFMPPTSEKLRGHIGLGLSVQSSPVQSSLSVILE